MTDHWAGIPRAFGAGVADVVKCDRPTAVVAENLILAQTAESSVELDRVAVEPVTRDLCFAGDLLARAGIGQPHFGRAGWRGGS